MWRERLGHSRDDHFVQMAFAERELAGFVCAYGAHDCRRGSSIDNLHVARAFARKGIGEALMKRTGAWLVSRYPDRGVYLLVLEANTSARRFYERLGTRSAEVSTMETHGGALVRSCWYVWPRPQLPSSCPTRRS